MEFVGFEPSPCLAAAVSDDALPILRRVITQGDIQPGQDRQGQLSIVCYALGRMIGSGLESLPLSTLEDSARIVLESGVLMGMPETETIAAIGATHPLSYSLTRTNSGSGVISRGLSYDVSESRNEFSPGMQKAFLTSMMTPSNNPADWANGFVEFMNSSIRASIKTRNDLLAIERIVAAALLKQLALVSEALSLARKLSNEKPKPDKLLVPNELKRIWEQIYRLRRDLVNSRQVTGIRHGPPTQLIEDFPAFSQEIITKAEFLLASHPVINIRTDKSARETLEQLYAFIVSSPRMTSLKDMIALRTRRLQYRLDALKAFLKISKASVLSPDLEIIFLMAIEPAFRALSSLRDVVSVDPERVAQFRKQFSKVFGLLVDRIVSPETQNVLRLLVIKMLAHPLHSVVEEETFCQAAMKFLSFVQRSSSDDSHVLAAFSLIWRLAGLWLLQAHSAEIVGQLLHLSAMPELESCQHKAILLLAVLSGAGDCKTYGIGEIWKCLPGASPRVVVAIFIWLAQFL
jgi:hypothetical protein